MSFLISFLSSFLMKAIPWLISKGMEYYRDYEGTKMTDEEIDKRLAALKDSYKKAMTDGPMTPIQREELHNAISDFIKHGANGGL
jgi:hypothetical protein